MSGTTAHFLSDFFTVFYEILVPKFRKNENNPKSSQPVRAEGLILNLGSDYRLASGGGFEPLLPP